MTTDTQILLDTDILSAILRGDPRVISKAHEYLTKFDIFTFSVITMYEIFRGLRAKKAEKQIEIFSQFCKRCAIFPLNEETVSEAASIYSDLYRRGLLISDADILIAATAVVNDFTLATNNLEHFSRIANLRIATWLR